MYRLSSTPIFALSTILAFAACNTESMQEKGAAAAGIPSSFCVGVEGTTYGAGISEMDGVSIAEIAADPFAYDGKTVRVEGTVMDVCSKRGCWFEIVGESADEKVRFKVNDGDMVFPVELKGDYAVAQGTVVAEELSLEETRARQEHFAEEAGKSFDPESITEGMTVFRIQGTGAVIGEKM
jgi:hypothetical protein